MSYNNSKIQVLFPLGLAAVLAIGLLGGYFLGNRHSAFNSSNSGKLEEILNLIDSKYVDTLNRKDLEEKVIPDMLKNLDPHSVYIPAKDLESVNEDLDGGFGGIGVQFSIQNDTVMVVQVISGGPSEKVGIINGDRIVMVNDTAFSGKKVTNELVMKKLRGPIGTEVRLGIQRRNRPDLIHVKIVRGLIPVNSVDVSYMVDSSIGYIKVSQFGRNTYREFLTGLAKLKSQGAQKLIVDLRGNSGGFLDIAINMCNEFLKSNSLIVYTQGKANPREDVFANGQGAFQNNQLVVLIDEYSASASEIFAGAIQDNDRGTIVGRRSFGKGLVQQQIPFADGSAMRLTIARYYTPSGRCIQKPYKPGSDDYFNDIVERYKHGEFFEKDSIKFDDKLKYKTKGGKTVYGGGGIMPDVFVPRDTSNISNYYMKLRDKAVVYEFALQYVDNNRDKLKNINQLNDLIEYLNKDNILNKLVDFGVKKGVEKNDKELAVSKYLLDVEVKAYIARNIFENEGFYPIIAQTDEVLQKGIEILKK